ncbi:MAG TPA: polysaccharide deacetylase family protein [Anaerolineales bacterium]|nr:polysaccharide deacetylase family protein [Anaerolineales bacterium]
MKPTIHFLGRWLGVWGLPALLSLSGLACAAGNLPLGATATPTADSAKTMAAATGAAESVKALSTHNAAQTLTALPSPTSTLSPTPANTATPLPTATLVPTAFPQPTPDSLASGRILRIPVLMYHHVGPVKEGANQLEYGLTVQTELFREQLQFLKNRGYTSISLYQAQSALMTGAPLPEKPIVLTFDDGYLDNYEYAFPLMSEFGYTGTLFIPTEFIDNKLEGRMSWEQIVEMHSAGWSVEPHSKTHPSLIDKPRDFLVYELLGSLQTIQYYIGYQPRFFCYPAGDYDDNVVAVLKELGYWGAVTTEFARDMRGDSPYLQGRVRVDGGMLMSDFANRLLETPP